MISNILKNASASKFDAFQTGVVDYATANAVPMGIDPAIIADLNRLKIMWKDAFDKCKPGGLVTDQDRENKNHIRMVYGERLYAFIYANLYFNEKVTTTDLVGMGLPASRRAKNTPTTFDLGESPSVKYFPQGACAVKFSSQNNSGAHTLPKGASQLQINYYVGDVPPADPADFPEQYVNAKCTGFLTFHATQAYQKVHFAARWLAKDAQNGQFSQVVSTVIVP